MSTGGLGEGCRESFSRGCGWGFGRGRCSGGSRSGGGGSSGDRSNTNIYGMMLVQVIVIECLDGKSRTSNPGTFCIPEQF